MLCQGEGNSDVERKRRVRCHLHGVQDHMHGLKQFSRKLGDLRNIQLFEVGSVGEGVMRHEFVWGLPVLATAIPRGRAPYQAKGFTMATPS